MADPFQGSRGVAFTSIWIHSIVWALLIRSLEVPFFWWVPWAVHMESCNFTENQFDVVKWLMAYMKLSCCRQFRPWCGNRYPGSSMLFSFHVACPESHCLCIVFVNHQMSLLGNLCNTTHQTPVEPVTQWIWLMCPTESPLSLIFYYWSFIWEDLGIYSILD